MAITSWTSEGMSWDSLAGKIPYRYVIALYKAAYERALVSGARDSSGSYYTTLLLWEPGLFDPMRPSFVSILDSAIDDMVLWFVNHTVSGGDFSNRGGDMGAPIEPFYPYGQYFGTAYRYNIFPMWTMEDMLDSIGASERIYWDDSPFFSEAWAMQAYQILNKLIWTGGWGALYGWTPKQIQTGWHYAWAEAVSAYNSASYTAGVPGRFLRRVSSHSSGDGYMITSYGAVDYTVECPNVSYNRNIDVYGHFQAYDVWENEDVAGMVDESTVSGTHIGYRINRSSTPFSSDIYNGGDYIFYGNWPGTSPASDTTQGWGSDPSFEGEQISAVYKWNVDGGFDFVV